MTPTSLLEAIFHATYFVIFLIVCHTFIFTVLYFLLFFHDSCISHYSEFCNKLDNCWRLPPLTVVFALLLIIEMFSIRLSEAKENRSYLYQAPLQCYGKFTEHVYQISRPHKRRSCSIFFNMIASAPVKLRTQLKNLLRSLKSQ